MAALACWAAFSLASWAGISLAAPSPAAASAAWLPAQALTEPGLETYSSTLAAGPQGEVLAALDVKEGTEIRANIESRPPGGTFGPPVPISARGANAESPSVVFDSKGDALAVWQRGGIIQAALRPPGGSFGAPQDVSLGGESASTPQAIFNSHGDAIVLWRTESGTPPEFTYRIKSNMMPAGGSFGAPQTLDTTSTKTTEENAFFSVPRLAADEQGDVFAAWLLETTSMAVEGSGSYAIKAAISSAGAPFAAAETLESRLLFGTEGIRLKEPDVAADPQGDAMVVWSQSNNTISTQTQAVEGKLRPAGGAFETLPESISGTVTGAFEPSVAFDRNGNATVIWAGAADATTGILTATRPAGGAFGSSQLLSESGVSSGSPALAITSKGDTLVAWAREDKTSRIETATRPDGGTFGEPLPISPDTTQYLTVSPGLAVDGQGNAIASWRRFETHYIEEFAPYDNAGPALQSLDIPSQGTAGSPLSFSVSPLDVWSAIGATSWDFGDGSTASAASATHTYATPGSYTVTLSSTDALGNATSTSGTLTIAPAPPAKGATGAPALANVRQSYKIWREGKRLASFSRKHISRKHKTPVGTIFSFSLNEQAHVSLTFKEQLTGRKAKGKCVAHTSNSRGRACKHTVIRGTLSLTAHTATNKISFQGRISRSRMLPPGHYEVVILATNAAKQRSQPQVLSFTILK